ncbi:MAG: FISUMP domain-containing protein [bacterium]
MKRLFTIIAVIIGFWSVATYAWVPGEDFTDPRDSKVYRTAQIGSQVWMTENLNVGELIMSTQAGYQMSDNGKIERYCWDNGTQGCDGTNGQMKRGGFYEWKEALQNYTGQQPQLPTRGICPNGWHIPSNAEWNTLFATIGAKDQPTLATAMLTGGSSGFNALLTGYRCTFTGSFRVSATAADTRTYYYTSEQADAENAPVIEIGASTFVLMNIPKSIGVCIRCIADSSNTPKPLINIIDTDIKFGEAEIDSTKEFELKIKNAGDAVLSISKMVINNNPDKAFVFMNPGFPLKIGAGRTETVVVKFTPKESKQYNSQLVITSNDETNTDYTLNLSGKGISSKPQISCASSFDMGLLEEGSSKTKKFSIKNSGDGELKINNVQLLNNNKEAFSINTFSGPVYIDGKDSIQIDVTFNPLEIGDYTATLRIYSNDEGTPQKDVAITGKASGQGAVGDDNSIFSINVNPNPFNSSTKCVINMLETKHIQIELCDINGRIVKVIYDGILAIGEKSFTIEGSNLESGVYIIKTKVDDYTTSTKIVITR